jgi:hypothetical protein
MSISANEPRQEEEKRFLRLPYVKDPKTPLYARVTLAAILFRQRLEDRAKFKGATVYWIARYTGIGYHTVKRHIKTLLDRPLIKETTKGYYEAVNSPLYARKKIKTGKTAKWFDAICTLRLPLPLPRKDGKPLLLPVVLMELLRHCRQEQTETGLGKMLGVSRQAVARAIALLDKQKLIHAEKQWIVYPSGKRFPNGFKLTCLQSAEAKEYKTTDNYRLKAKTADDTQDRKWEDGNEICRKQLLTDLKYFAIDETLKAEIIEKVVSGKILAAKVINALRSSIGKEVNNHLKTTLAL